MNNKDAIYFLLRSNEYHHAKGDLPHSAASIEAFNKAVEALKAERPHGEWIENKGKDIRDHFYTCSICGRTINVICGETLKDYPFCHCGADMRGEE